MRCKACNIILPYTNTDMELCGLCLGVATDCNIDIDPEETKDKEEKDDDDIPRYPEQWRGKKG
jgi:hypothetical protein